MTMLKPINDAWDDVLTAEAVRLPSVADQVNTTGLHPIATDRTRPTRHAHPWTAGHAYADAIDALACTPSTARHVDRTYLPGSMALLSHEVDSAEWTASTLGRCLGVIHLTPAQAAEWREAGAYL